MQTRKNTVESSIGIHTETNSQPAEVKRRLTENER